MAVSEAAKGYVRCDPIGTVDHTVTPPRRGGTVELRLCGWLPGVQVTWMSERAYRWGMAANAWYWRREDAKAGGS